MHFPTVNFHLQGEGGTALTVVRINAVLTTPIMYVLVRAYQTVRQSRCEKPSCPGTR